MKDIIFPITYKSDEKGLKVAEAQLSGFGTIAAGAFARIGAAAVDAFAQATRAVADFAVDSVKAASSFNETSAAIGQVFGENAKQLQEFASTAAGSFGQSQTQALQAAKTFGIFGKAAGLAGKENVDFSTTLTRLASDLASFNDTSVDEAITAIGAALRGESEPIRRFGVLLDDATLKARALEMGIYDGTGSLSQQQRVLAAYQEVLAQTTTQQGDFARTADGVANSSRSLQATWNDLQVTVGTALLPAVQAVIPQLTEFINQMVASPEFNQFIADMGTNFSNLLSYLPEALENLQSFGNDALPVINAFFPMLNDALYGMAAAFGFIEGSDPSTNTRSFADSMRDLADAMNTVGDAFRWVGDTINGINKAYNSLPGWMRMILSGGTTESLRQMSGFIDAVQTGNLGQIRKYLGVPNLSGTPDIPYIVGNNSAARGVRFAEGGIVTKPMRGLVGESGPEAIIPLDQLPAMTGSRGGNVINVNVTAGMGADGAALGEQIVNAIRRYERTSGAVFAKV